MAITPPASPGRLATILLGLVIAAAGLFLLIGGGYLIVLGGSRYFALAGLALVAAGALIVAGRSEGAALYLVVFLATLIWAIWEVGFSFWPLVSRLLAPAVLAVPVLLAAPGLKSGRVTIARRPAWGGAGLLGLCLAVTVAAAFQPQPMVSAEGAPPPQAGRSAAALSGGDWPAWGRTRAGTRFAPSAQITRANVRNLKVAWTYRTGEIPEGPEAFVVTPLHFDGLLYGCTASNVLFAVDAETGREIWRHDPQAKGDFRPRCRGLGYHDATHATRTTSGAAAAPLPDPAATCVRRILSTTVDARLLAVDARTGQSCPEFGQNGEVSLRAGMGYLKPGFYFPTAAPTVVRDLVIVGGLVRDNYETNEPSGVVRAFNVRTGALVWAWDVGNPGLTGQPAPGQSYTRGTPNVWSTPSVDEALGLIYLPTGNATPDFWGGRRTEAAERYSSSIVALDIATGRERWRFQTTHHDVWDYDVPSQPALYDVPDGRGGLVPALIQTTKRGQIFMLDRRTGVPIARVVERPVVQTGGAPDERLSPTQPYSVGMPALGAERLTEARMWGATPLDQLMCRIAFRKVRYDGDFTPPGPTAGLLFPGWLGGMNWGSVSIAENLGYMIVNDTRVPVVNRLVPRAVYDAANSGSGSEGGGAPQYGTPWGIEQSQFLSPLGVPCQAPPYGAITAIDLATRKVLWSMPLGTVQDTGPLGVAMHLPIPIGLPAIGGPITTRSGLVFMAGTQDHYLRALDVRTGRELWKGRLPMGAETTPMTYTSPRTGRQFVTITAGGNAATKDRGDYIIAYALPS